MTHFRMILLLLAASALYGCGAAKEVVIETKEKVKVVTHTELVPVIATIEVPSAIIENTVKDSSSHLETDFAKSDARINRDGTLTHSLENKEQTLQKEVVVQVEYKDSIVYKEREVPVKVEKKLTHWQKFRLDAFWWLALALAVLIAIKLTKIWRN